MVPQLKLIFFLLSTSGGHSYSCSSEEVLKGWLHDVRRQDRKLLIDQNRDVVEN